MKKIRLSQSLINYWERGDVQGAINCYFHIDKGTTRQMEEGRKYHEDIANSIDKTGKTPEYMAFNYDFKDSETEKAITVPYNEICDVKGIIDCLDGKNMFEWKTGVSGSADWARTNQLPLYFMICDLAGIEVTSAYVVHYNQYTEKTDYTIVHNSEKLIEKGRNIVDSVCYEIRDYFNEQGLLGED